jgi:hypothetical protein
MPRRRSLDARGCDASLPQHIQYWLHLQQRRDRHAYMDTFMFCIPAHGGAVPQHFVGAEGVRRSISCATTRAGSRSAESGRTTCLSSRHPAGSCSTTVRLDALGMRLRVSRRPVVSAWRPKETWPRRPWRNRSTSVASIVATIIISVGRQPRPSWRKDAGTRSRICSFHHVNASVSIVVSPSASLA